MIAEGMLSSRAFENMYKIFRMFPDVPLEDRRRIRKDADDDEREDRDALH